MMDKLPVANWDHAGLAIAYALRSPWLDSFFLAITWLGSLAVLLPLAVLLWWWQGKPAGFVALALVTSSAVVHLAKLLLERPRPEYFPALIDMPADASFPSAHAMQAAAFALGWLLRPGNMPGYGESVVLLLVVALVCFSRLYLQVHFPSDVVAGVILAILWVWLLHRWLTSRESSA